MLAQTLLTSLRNASPSSMAEHPRQYSVAATTNAKHLKLFVEAEEWLILN